MRRRGQSKAFMARLRKKYRLGEYRRPARSRARRTRTRTRTRSRMGTRARARARERREGIAVPAYRSDGTGIGIGPMRGVDRAAGDPRSGSYGGQGAVIGPNPRSESALRRLV